MRKVLAGLLCLVMLACPLAAMGEKFVSEDTGISFPVPEGFTAAEAVNEEFGSYGIIVAADDGSVQYMLALAYDEAYVGLDLAEADEEDLIALAEFVNVTQEEGFTYELTLDDGDPYVVYVSEAGDKVVIVYIDPTEGLMIAIAAVAPSGGALTEEHLDEYDLFLDTLEFAE
jgi:hypothetical protein